ncbi:MAG TPA: DUF6542 domain-containing protein [Actinomycetes bacterium]|nr:DUF6542 domain-containing protein [Actinomycetes bacterium]
MTAGPVDPPTARPAESGLRLPGLLAVLLVGTAVGATVDLMVSGKYGWGINVAFAISALLAASTVRRRDLLAAVLAAPIAFAVVVTVGLLVTDGYDGLIKTGLLLATELALLAPGVWLGTAIAAAVALLRRRG